MDVLTPEQRRKNMQAIKNKNTKIEELLAKALWTKGYRYRRNNRTVFGKPDFTFKKYKVAIFCDSEYFHGKDWEIQKHRIKTNTEFWNKKIENNIERDRIVNSRLLKNGWKVIRFWGQDIKKNIDHCMYEIESAIAERKMIKYSDLRENIEIQPLKDEDNQQAFVTHYLHNMNNGTAHWFEESANEYLSKFTQKHPLLKQKKINFKWDIPFPTPEKPKFKFIDLFAGIGGIRLAYQKVGGKCVFSSEYDKFAKVTYEANFGEVPFGDITKINEKDIPDHDVLLAGFPCQPFSIAGVSKKNSLGKKHGFCLGITTRVGLSVIALVLQHKSYGAPVASSDRLLATHIPNATKQRLPLQSLTQLAA